MRQEKGYNLACWPQSKTKALSWQERNSTEYPKGCPCREPSPRKPKQVVPHFCLPQVSAHPPCPLFSPCRSQQGCWRNLVWGWVSETLGYRNTRRGGLEAGFFPSGSLVFQREFDLVLDCSPWLGLGRGIGGWGSPALLNP